MPSVEVSGFRIAVETGDDMGCVRRGQLSNGQVMKDNELSNREEVLNRDEASAEQILQTALGRLARREHGRRELRQKLLRRFGQHPELDRILDHLEAQRYLSDRRFAASLARSRVNKGYGPV